MSDAVREAIAERMNRLPFVKWDRAVVHDWTAVAYGWIAREDERSDFVVIDVQWGVAAGLDGSDVPWLAVGHTTSSADRSEEISALLNPGGSGAGHKACERITDVFGTLVRV